MNLYLFVLINAALYINENHYALIRLPMDVKYKENNNE